MEYVNLKSNFDESKKILEELSDKNEAVKITVQTNSLEKGTLTFQEFENFNSIFEDVDKLIIKGQVQFFDGMNHLAKTNQKLVNILKIEIYNNFGWDVLYSHKKKKQA